MSLYDGKFTIILLANITLDSKPRRDIDISWMSYGFSYLLHFIDEVHKVFKRCHNIVGKVFRLKKRSALPLKGGWGLLTLTLWRGLKGREKHYNRYGLIDITTIGKE